MHIKSIKKIEKTDYVYDLTIKDTHCYFANDILVHNCHRISDFVLKEKIAPMIGSFSVSKTIKLGISLYKNNFFQSCMSPNTKYKVLKKNWRECDIFWNQGSIRYEGKDYPKRIVDLMPRKIKQQLFPNDLSLQYDSVEGFSEIDWNTQYEMIWMEDINLVLSGEQQAALLSGDFDILEKGRPEMTEKYFFGLDTASGTLMPGQKDLDWTVLSIWRKNQDNTKDCVYKQAWQGDVVQQMEDIKELVHPLDGTFQCVMGLADYSNIAIGIVEMFKKEGIPIAGVTFGATEPTTKKNYKNAMTDQFVFELESGRVRYPTMDKIENNKLFKEAFSQWCLLEKHRKTGINAQIFVDPSMGHDDHYAADILGVWACDQQAAYSGKVPRTMKGIPTPVAGLSNLSGVGTPMPGQPGDPNAGKFLKDRLT